MRSKSSDLFQNTLVAATLKPDTRRKYSEAIIEFMASHHGFHSTAQDLDEMISAYILTRFKKILDQGNVIRWVVSQLGYVCCTHNLKVAFENPIDVLKDERSLCLPNLPCL